METRSCTKELDPLNTDSFVFLFLVSYLFGSVDSHAVARRYPRFKVIERLLSRTREGRVKRSLSFVPIALIELGKGVFSLLVAKSLIGTGMSYAVASLACFLGCNWPIDRRPKDGHCILSILPTFVVFSWQGTAILAVIWSLVRFVSTVEEVAIIAVAFIAPPVFWCFRQKDLYVLFSFAVLIVIVYQYLPAIDISCGKQKDPLLVSGGKYKSGIKQVYFRRIFAVLLLLILGSVVFFNRYVYRGFGLHSELFRHGNRQLKFIAITFDDGPDPQYTPKILDILREENVKATFFVVGTHVAKYPEIALRIVEEGHEIGNHTYSHRNLYRLSKEHIVEEIEKAHEVIMLVTGEEAHLLRPPRGMYDSNVVEISHARRYTIALWSLSSQDWAEVSAGTVKRNILNNIQNGDILLFHDSGNIVSYEGGDRHNTVVALPVIIRELRDMGYQFVTITEMMIISGLTEEE